MTRRLACVAFFLYATLLAPAAFGQSLTATVDRSEVRMGESLLLRLSVKGLRKSPAPQLPDLSAFQVASLGPTSHVDLISGRLSSEIRFHYRLSPREPGEHHIGPAVVEIGDHHLESSPFVIRVLPADAVPEGAGRREDELFVTATVSTREPFVGQQVIYRWRLWRRVRLEAVGLSGPFQFSGVLVEDLGDVRRYEEVRNGHLYRVQEITKALFPRRAGRVVLTAPELHAEMLKRRSTVNDEPGRLETEALTLYTPELVLTVRPLPSPPAVFSGLVGQFEVATSLSRGELAAGESTTLEVTISGKGNIRSVPPPTVKIPPELKVYEEPPETAMSRQGDGLAGSKRFTRALVPLQPGEHRLPPVSVTYFDPDAEAYRTASSEALTLRVRPGEGGEGITTSGNELAMDGAKLAVHVNDDQIRPLIRDLDAVDPGFVARLGRAGALSFALVPPLACFGLWLARRRRERYAQDGGLERRQKARRRALARLREVENLEGGDDRRAATEAASRLLRAFVGDKLGLTGGALTPEETAQHLVHGGLAPESAERLRAYLEDLEAAGYGGPQNDPAAPGVATRAREELLLLDREVRRAQKG